MCGWILEDGTWLARAIVNRTWAWVMGRGIIHEPDDFREDNPPSNPELLDYLEAEMKAISQALEQHERDDRFRYVRHVFSNVIAELDRLDDDIGLDTIEMGATIGVAMEAGLAEFGDGHLPL